MPICEKRTNQLLTKYIKTNLKLGQVMVRIRSLASPSDIQGGTKLTFVKSFLQEIGVDHCVRSREYSYEQQYTIFGKYSQSR